MLFQALNEAGITLLVVTHERDVASYTRRVIELCDGRLVRDEPVRNQRTASADLAARYVEDEVG